ncbi:MULTISPECIES: hypothetical protein [Clostridium]|uniref:Class I SAM-dependent methyltransferase n=1 Tax=Clostridium subterminale TaxID=1550 RepID=A0ABP3VPS6_CLOSU
MESLFVNLEKEIFRGNILDITYGNEGIIYKANKYYDNFIDVDYLEDTPSKRFDNEGYYDSCIVFFTLNKIKSHRQKLKLFDNIYRLMKKNGYVYIWDVEKEPLKTLQKNITVSLPDKSMKNFQINLLNIFTDNTSSKIIDGLKDYFDIVEAVSSNGTFRIVGRRKDVNKK